MKSIKPGRGPSFMNGIGSIAVGVFGVIWTIAALSMGAPILFGLFGVVFVLVAAVNAIYSLSNATRKNRFSAYDITEDDEEEDSLNRRFGEQQTAFCPQCGQKVAEGDRFCRRCGKSLG